MEWDNDPIKPTASNTRNNSYGVRITFSNAGGGIFVSLGAAVVNGLQFQQGDRISRKFCRKRAEMCLFKITPDEGLPGWTPYKRETECSPLRVQIPGHAMPKEIRKAFDQMATGAGYCDPDWVVTNEGVVISWVRMVGKKGHAAASKMRNMGSKPA